METIIPQETYFAIAAIVDKACADLDLPTDKYFQRLLSFALWGYAQIKMDADYQPITELFNVSPVNTVQLPASCIDIVKIGIPDGQYVRTMSICPELSTQERTPNNPQFSQTFPPGFLPNGTDITSYGGLYSFSNFGGRALFSVGGNLPSTGNYKIVKRDDGHKEVLLDAGFNCHKIYIEYISFGINPNGCTVCHPYVADFVLKYIHHEYEKFLRPPQRSESAIERTGRDLWHSEIVTKARLSQIDKGTLLTILRRHYRLTNKT